MENENFEKQIYEFIDNANKGIPSFKTKKKRHFPFKMLLASLSTVCVILIVSIILNLNNSNSKNAASGAVQNEVNNIPQVDAETSLNDASFIENATCTNSIFSEQVKSETTSSNSDTTLSAF